MQVVLHLRVGEECQRHFPRFGVALGVCRTGHRKSWQGTGVHDDGVKANVATVLCQTVYIPDLFRKDIREHSVCNVELM